jgi:CBS domain-containing protein
MTIVANILSARKNFELATLPASATVRNALELMARRDIGSVLVMQDGALLGIFTERDYARRIVLKGIASIDTPLSDVMTTSLYVVGPRQTAQECLGIMTQAKLRHLPVFDSGKVIGLVSIGDLIHAQLAEQKFLIEQLENYITSNI